MESSSKLVLKDKQVFFFKIPNQIKNLFDSSKDTSQLGEILLKDNQMFIKLTKKQEQTKGQQEHLEFKLQDITTQADLNKFIMKTTGEENATESQNARGRPSQKKRAVKAKLKMKIHKHIQMTPQQFVASNLEALNPEKTNIESYTKPPEQLFTDRIFKFEEGPQDTSTSGRRGQQSKDRRVALDPDHLKEEIFILFQRSKEYTLEEVQSILNQPREPVRKILDDICDLNRGTRKYELKRSYHH